MAGPAHRRGGRKPVASKKAAPRKKRAGPRARASAAPKKSFRPIRAFFGLIFNFMIGAGLIGALALGAYAYHLDKIIRTQFEGNRWALPAHVYARPLEIYPGIAFNADQFEREMADVEYRKVDSLARPGSFTRDGDLFQVYTRKFNFWDGIEPSRRLQVSFKGDRLQSTTDIDRGESMLLTRFEPAQIAGIYPAHAEDRILVKRSELPDILVDALIALEDRSFYDHYGVKPKAIARALLANYRAGRRVQGGSTLTQQLVKNFFLTNERSYVRKLNEALMALLVERHYTKDQILEAYANEIYLGQDGKRAIHGMGLASRYYFGRPLAELNLHHVSLLVGMIRGPSQYNPHSKPENAKERRAVVLNVMADQGLISAHDAETAKAMPLGVVTRANTSGDTKYPAFVDMVRRQLKEFYREEDLTSDGLRIFTSLDPRVQEVAEEGITAGLPILEKKVKLEPDTLQSAAVVANTQTGEVLALVGDRNSRLAGFNRALDAKRPAGSLLKPAVYLTALEDPSRYTLASMLDDSPFLYRSSSGEVWEPKNYDKRNRDFVMLRDALAKSYNVPTARIGVDLSLQEIVKTLKRLGATTEMQPFPSLVLGAVDLTPIEIAQIYETIASGGYRMPLRSIRAVTSGNGDLLSRYELKVTTAISPEPAYLITKAMQRVVSNGTARSMSQKISSKMKIAGKTGTTDELRDSWFAGFSGNILNVVWVGRDDNTPAKLTGGSGALRIWMDIMRELDLQPLDLTRPSGIQDVLIDTESGLLADANCTSTERISFIRHSQPRDPAPCTAEYQYYWNSQNSTEYTETQGGTQLAPTSTLSTASPDQPSIGELLERQRNERNPNR